MAQVQLQQHFISNDGIKPMIRTRAKRFMSSEDEVDVLVDRTMMKASCGLDTIAEMELDRALFC